MYLASLKAKVKIYIEPKLWIRRKDSCILQITYVFLPDCSLNKAVNI